VEAGSLGFSITIFTITAVLSLGLLVTRRYVLKGIGHSCFVDIFNEILIFFLLDCHLLAVVENWEDL
jgi:hypothetical protein